MRRLVWKVRYAHRLRQLTRIPYLDCWHSAEAMLYVVNQDLTECPLECAYQEYLAMLYG